MSTLTQPADSGVLALATTLHLALLVLRRHLSPSRPLLLAPAVLFAALVWALPAPVALLGTLALHLGWFLACQRLLPAPPPARAAGRGAAAVAAGAAAPARPAAAPEPRPLPAARVPAAPPAAFVPVPVLAVFDETPDIRTFRMARPASFAFKAGQYLTVRVLVDGKPLMRCYSVSSAPESSGYLEISVKRQGLVSSTLHAVVRPGSSLHLRAPAGPFVYPQDDDRPLVLLAGGVGITPLISMLRHAVAADPTRPVALALSVRTEDDVPFREELRLLSRRHPQIRIAVAVTRDCRSPEHYPGRIDAALLSQLVPEPAGAVYYLCGPGPMVAGLKELLASLGVPAAQVRSEAFEAAVKAASAAPASPPAEVPSPEPQAPGESYTLQLVKSGKQAQVTESQTLLEAAEEVGADIPNACRAGVCHTCMTRLVEGDVDCDTEGLEKGYVLPCVSRARSSCALDA